MSRIFFKDQRQESLLGLIEDFESTSTCTDYKGTCADYKSMWLHETVSIQVASASVSVAL